MPAARPASARTDLLPDESFIRFEEREVGKYPNVTVEHIPLQCMHCEDAPLRGRVPHGRGLPSVPMASWEWTRGAASAASTA